MRWQTVSIGLHWPRSGIWAKTLFVLLAVVAFLALVAVFPQVAAASLIDPDGVTEVVEDAVDDVVDDAVVEVVEVVDEVPEVVEETADVVEVVEVVDEVLDVVDEETVDEVEGGVDDVVEVVVDDVVEVVVEINPPIENGSAGQWEESGSLEEIPVPYDVAGLVPPVAEVGDLLPTLPLEGIVAPTLVAVPPWPPAGASLDPPLANEIARPRSQGSSGLFGEQVATELAYVRLSDLRTGVAGDSPSPTTEDSAPFLVAYTPMPGPLPVERGASGSGSSTHAPGSILGGIDPYGFFAALAALLALCLVGWIRDRSRSGRSIFPSHGGRPG